ncbi:hypothetical protein AAFC00_004660 [Neodothiora populina]|uniref:DUF7593 domain-containing protein n=1 Tax=Neodothiora populina TaxID=2781224 RepID=A0ABR3P2R1_9PEZI
MSDSTSITAIPRQVLAGTPGYVNFDESSVAHGQNAPSAHLPKSSPPQLQQEEDGKSLLKGPSALEPNGNGTRNNTDIENDSEAETLISSPVKKRQALREAERRDSNHVSYKDGNATDTHHSAEEENRTEQKNGTKGLDRCKHGGAPETNETDATGGAAVHDDDDDESDNLSEVMSMRSSFAGSDTEGLLRGARAKVDNNEGGHSDDDDEDTKSKTNRIGETSHTRKRKRRESYLQANMEPPRRRRRASDEARTHGRKENGGSTSPQLRRHRRTISTQASWTDQSRNSTGPSSGRSRRAATQFPVREVKPTRNHWDSDTSSEASQQHHFNRLTRNVNRSVSTPGRPLGRDHKRHVNKYGFTRLAEACENGDLESVKEWRNKDPEQLEQREFAGNTPLQVASLNGYPEIVRYLLAEKCNPHTANTDQDTPLIDAVENGHIEVVRLLLEAGVNPLRQNLKGQQALDVITEDTENAQEIRAALREAIEEWRNNDDGQQQQREGDPVQRPGPSKELHFLAYTSSNLLRLAGENDQAGILELLKAQVQVTNEIVAAAARTGDTFTVSMLLAEMKPRDAKKRPELPLLAVVGTSHFEMVKYLTGADGFNPTWRSRSNGMTWYELAQQRQGPNWQQEKDLFKRLYDERMQSERLSSSPVSRRENGKRRRSPQRRSDSDAELDDLDSNEQARSRRRLVSKKVMRQASHGRRPFSSSDSDHDHNDSVDGEESHCQDKRSSKPAKGRKGGRPRKASTSSHNSEVQEKHRSSSRPRTHRKPLESPDVEKPTVTSEAEDRAHDEQSVKLEDADQHGEEIDAQAEAELAAQAQAQAQAEAAEKAELEAKIKAELLAEEKIKAEQVKKEEEEARRMEAKRKAEEIRQQHQRRMAEERRVKTEELLQALPSALRHVLGPAMASEVEKQKYVQRHFLPIQVVKRVDIGSVVGEHEEPDDLWMLSYQAAAILTNTGAAALLGLPVDPSAVQSSLARTVSIEVSQEQRRAMLLCLQSNSLVHPLPSADEDFEHEDLIAELVLAEKTRLQIADDRSRFLSMDSLRWIKYSDFMTAATHADSPDCVHLSGLSLDYRFDCCLDPTPFLLHDKKGNSPSSDKNNDKVMVAAAQQEEKAAVMGVNGGGGGRGRYDDAAAAAPSQTQTQRRAGPGITTFTIVQD